MEPLSVLLWLVVCLFLGGLLFFFCQVWQWSSLRVYWNLLSVPSATPIPILGDTIYFAGRTVEDLVAELLEGQTQERYKTFIRALCIGIPCVIIFQPDDIETILGCNVNIKKGFEYFPMKQWLREGLLLSDGGKWRKRRKLLTPTFHFKILENNVGQISEHTDKFVQKLLATQGKTIVLEDLVMNYTLDVICETAMDIKMNAQDNNSMGYVEAVKRTSDIVVERIMKPWLLRDWIFNLTTDGKNFNKELKIIHNFSEKVIADRKEERNRLKGQYNETNTRKAFLDKLLETEEEHPGTFTSLDIREEVDTFMFEGHDTTSSAIIFAIYSLATNPEVQERALEEQNQIFGSDERNPTIQDLHDMTYLDMVIKEVLRLYPPVPFISRMLLKDTKIGGVVLAAGTNITLSPYLLHRNMNIWENPLEFIPERFLPGVSRHPYSYLPFSAGPRNCIGQKFAMMELKTTLSAVVRKCYLQPVSTKLRLSPQVILRNINPTEIRVTPRMDHQGQ